MRGTGALLAASLSVVLLASCGGDGNGATEDDTDTIALAEHAGETSGPADITEGKGWGPRIVDDERGTLVKKVGQWAALGGDDEVIAAFRVTEIEPDLRCTGEEAQDPVNGRFVGLRFEVEASPSLGESGSMATFNLHPEQFTAVLPDGATQGRLLGEARACLPRDAYLPDAVTAGSRETGMLVLDVPEDTEAVVLEGRPFGSVGGWEWALP